MNHTEASLAQRRRNSAAIAARKKKQKFCKWGHNDWRILPDGRRRCGTCNKLRSWYYKRGLEIPPGGPS